MVEQSDSFSRYITVYNTGDADIAPYGVCMLDEDVPVQVERKARIVCIKTFSLPKQPDDISQRHVTLQCLVAGPHGIKSRKYGLGTFAYDAPAWVSLRIPTEPTRVDNQTWPNNNPRRFPYTEIGPVDNADGENQRDSMQPVSFGWKVIRVDIQKAQPPQQGEGWALVMQRPAERLYHMVMADDHAGQVFGRPVSFGSGAIYGHDGPRLCGLAHVVIPWQSENMTQPGNTPQGHVFRSQDAYPVRFDTCTGVVACGYEDQNSAILGIPGSHQSPIFTAVFRDGRFWAVGGYHSFVGLLGDTTDNVASIVLDGTTDVVTCLPPFGMELATGVSLTAGQRSIVVETPSGLKPIALGCPEPTNTGA